MADDVSAMSIRDLQSTVTPPMLSTDSVVEMAHRIYMASVICHSGCVMFLGLASAAREIGFQGSWYLRRADSVPESPGI
jgi:hypothetical protein